MNRRSKKRRRGVATPFRNLSFSEQENLVLQELEWTSETAPVRLRDFAAVPAIAIGRPQDMVAPSENSSRFCQSCHDTFRVATTRQKSPRVATSRLFPTVCKDYVKTAVGLETLITLCNFRWLSTFYFMKFFSTFSLVEMRKAFKDRKSQSLDSALEKRWVAVEEQNARGYVFLFHTETKNRKFSSRFICSMYLTVIWFCCFEEPDTKPSEQKIPCKTTKRFLQAVWFLLVSNNIRVWFRHNA